MKLGVFFDGFCPTAEMLEVAAAVEAAGATSLWFAQHMGYRDAIVWAAAAAGVTRRVTLVPTAITPYLWPPLPVAMAMSTLAEASGGRVALAVSIGNLLNLDQSGVAPVRPVRVIRDYVETLRALQAGETVRHDGVVHTLRGAAMRFAEKDTYPLYVASTGPQMLGLAGEIGDGVLLSAGLTLAACRRCIDFAEAGAKKVGRDPGAVRKAAFINMAVSQDGAAARAAMLRKLAFLFRSRGHADNIASSGLDIDHQAIIDHLSRHDLDAATRLLPEAAAQAFAVAGTPSECRDRLGEYLAIGLDEPIIEVTGNREERALALDLIRQLAGEAA